MNMKYLMAFLVIAAIGGCAPPNDSAQIERSTYVVIQDSPRFTVTRTGVFVDSLAYGNNRGIYVIKDNQTGVEYVGVSGIGIAETASHMVGKTPVADER